MYAKLNERQTALLKLLEQGSYTWAEIEKSSAQYNGITRRTFERDLALLAENGYEIVTERVVGSRYVAHRLTTAPGRELPREMAELKQFTPLEPGADMTPLEVGQYLGLSYRRVNIMCNEGRIKVSRENPRLITREEAQRFAAIPRQNGRPKEPG